MKKLILMSALLMSSAAFARPYGNAGCGLGSLAFGNEPGASQIFAATTNGTSGTQTFGISSGTSNCIDHGAVRGAKAVPAFIEVNKLALAEDASRGQGETIAGLANLMGCKSGGLSHILKSNYQHIFVDTKMDAAAIEANINSSVASDKSNACGA